MDTKKVLKAKRLPGIFPDDFVCELTREIDKHLKDGFNDIRLGWCTYLYQLDDPVNSMVAIRFPGATRGYIELDNDNTIVDIEIYDQSRDVYKETVKEAVKQFIGYKIIIDDEGEK